MEIYSKQATPDKPDLEAWLRDDIPAAVAQAWRDDDLPGLAALGCFMGMLLCDVEESVQKPTTSAESSAMVAGTVYALLRRQGIETDPVDLMARFKADPHQAEAKGRLAALYDRMDRYLGRG